jgi:hypothetical protein
LACVGVSFKMLPGGTANAKKCCSWQCLR